MQAILDEARARFFNGYNDGHMWTYLQEYHADVVFRVQNIPAGQYRNSQYLNSGVSFYTGNVIGPGIDCSHLVQQAELAAGYNVRYIPTIDMRGIVLAGADSQGQYQVIRQPDWSTVQPGDLVVFKNVANPAWGHVGIITDWSYDPVKKVGTNQWGQTRLILH